MFPPFISKIKFSLGLGGCVCMHAQYSRELVFKTGSYIPLGIHKDFPIGAQTCIVQFPDPRLTYIHFPKDAVPKDIPVIKAQMALFHTSSLTTGLLPLQV